MSYESSYKSRLNTSTGSESYSGLSENVIAAVTTIRKSARQSFERLDKMICREVHFPVSVEKLQCEVSNRIEAQAAQYNAGVSYTVCQGNMVNSQLMKAYVDCNLITVPKESELALLKRGKTDLRMIVEQCMIPVRETVMDLQTTVAVQAAVNCGLRVIDTHAKAKSQILVTQNVKGTVVAVRIEPEKLSIDIAGLADESCKSVAAAYVAELGKLGLHCVVDTEREHRRKRGGAMLSFGTKAVTIDKAAEIKESLKGRKNMHLSLPLHEKGTINHKNSERERL